MPILTPCFRRHSPQRHQGRPALALWLALPFVALLGTALVACGSPSASGQGSITPVPNGACGTIQLRGGATVLSSTPPQAETCFWQAYTRCQSATLVVNSIGVDAGTDRTFSVKRSTSGSCTISDKAQTFVAPTSGGHVNTYTCAGLIQQHGGLLFQSCGNDGSISVPAPSGTSGDRP